MISDILKNLDDDGELLKKNNMPARRYVQPEGHTHNLTATV